MCIRLIHVCQGLRDGDADKPKDSHEVSGDQNKADDKAPTSTRKKDTVLLQLKLRTGQVPDVILNP